MKRVLTITMLSIVVPCLTLGQMGNNKLNQTPAVHIIYPAPDGTVFDRNCSEFMKTEINREWVKETVRRAPEFQSQWDREGPAYLSAAFAEVGLKFPFREMQAVLTVCPVNSMSAPLIINVRRFLSSAQKPAPPCFFSETVFHELMHTYTRQVYEVSALRKKYATEPVTVLAPEMVYEGTDLPLEASKPDDAPGRVCQLRDPAALPLPKSKASFSRNDCGTSLQLVLHES